MRNESAGVPARAQEMDPCGHSRCRIGINSRKLNASDADEYAWWRVAVPRIGYTLHEPLGKAHTKFGKLIGKTHWVDEDSFP